MSAFQIFGKDVKTNERYFEFSFEQEPFPDLTARDDGVIGNLKWVPGDRIAYHTAYAFLDHFDPGHHDYLHGLRVLFQQYGPFNVQINDKFMPEFIPDGLPPYPYEEEPALPFDKSRPGGVISIYHDRNPQRPDGTYISAEKYSQLLGKFIVPATSPGNSKVKWYYQLGGLFIGEHSDTGVFARIIVSSMHPRYAFAIEGVNTKSLSLRT